MRSRKRVIRRVTSSGQSKYVFSSVFEERKTLECLRNLLTSKYLDSKTTELFNFAMTTLGKREAWNIINRDYTGMFDAEILNRWLVRDYDPDFPASITKRILKEYVFPTLEKRIARISNKRFVRTEQRLDVLQEVFALNPEEREIIAFFYLIKRASPIMRDFLERSANVEDFSEISRFTAYGDVLLGISRPKFMHALSRGTLLKANLLEKSENCDSEMTIAAWCGDYISGIGKADISSALFDRNNDEQLALDDFDISPDELMVLDTIMKGRYCKNILLYGAPGTGKSSFARCLTKTYSKELLTVKVPANDRIKDRIRGIYATVNLADKKKNIVLIDEADEIINTSRSQLFDSLTTKSWINTFLETHGKTVFWISNRSTEIDSSTMRRFAFVMEFKKLDPQKRLKVLTYELKKKGIDEGYFTAEELRELCQNHAVNAAGIVNAIEVASITKRSNKGIALKKIRTVLSNHEKAIGAKKERNERERSFDRYVLEGLRTSANLPDIVESLKYQKAESGKNALISMLLHGMPGTGKTEFVYYLGHILKKDVILKRSSEIQSKWVGETEKNIASAFEEGRETGGILFFDEADSFLFPRQGAMHSWEKSHTNEILTQLENHSGIVIFSTNDIDGLDHAALRRFGFKIRFDPLTPEGNILFFQNMLMPLAQNCGELTSFQMERLKAISNLTPGDFAVVRKQIALLGSQNIGYAELITALENEVSYKKSIGRAIGF